MLPKLRASGRYLGVNIGVNPDTERWSPCMVGRRRGEGLLDGDRETADALRHRHRRLHRHRLGAGADVDLYQGCSYRRRLRCTSTGFLSPARARSGVLPQGRSRVTIQQIGCWRLPIMPQNCGINGLVPFYSALGPR